MHAHSIKVSTNYPLCQVLQKLEPSGRLLKWAIELGQFDVNFHPKTIIKGQTLVDFITEFTYTSIAQVDGTAYGAKATKVVKAANKEDSVPTQEDA